MKSGADSMYRVVAIAIACATVAACAGDTSKATDPIKKGMTSLVGQPLVFAIAKLGAPIANSAIGDRKVYVWSTRNVVDGIEYKCQIRVMMNDDVIGSFDWEGNNAGCAQYASMLKSNDDVRDLSNTHR
jgi:hypothetical protein